MLRETVKGLLDRMGYVIQRKDEVLSFPLDMEEDFLELYRQSKAFSMTSIQRMYALYQAVVHVVKCGIPGDVVECGVWKGGSSMLAARTLCKLHDTDRKIYLYDTFAGMSEPTDKDKNFRDESARQQWDESREQQLNRWCYSPLEEVRNNLNSTGYPAENLVFIQGKIEETIPGTVPNQISILRLDTDWYESTYHELQHLFPRLSLNGILIVDDYGYWKGAKEAVDKYFEESGIKLLLHRIDVGRIGVKTNPRSSSAP